MTNPNAFNGFYVQSKGAVCSPSSDGGVIYSPSSGSYYAINEVAMSIWNHLESATTAKQVTEALVAEYDAPLDVLEEDVRATLKYLESLHLVERGER